VEGLVLCGQQGQGRRLVDVQLLLDVGHLLVKHLLLPQQLLDVQCSHVRACCCCRCLRLGLGLGLGLRLGNGRGDWRGW
jgi:hypothetical protein